MTGKLVRLPSGRWVSEGSVAEHDVPRDELWSILDWSFWGAGMADTFRVPLADTMIRAISPEQHRQALELIERWTRLKGERAFQARYKELMAENEALKRELAQAREQDCM